MAMIKVNYRTTAASNHRYSIVKWNNDVHVLFQCTHFNMKTL